MGLSVLTASTDVSVPSTDLLAHVRGSTTELALIASYRRAAEAYCEGYTRRSLLPQTYRLTLSAWPDEIELPRSPVLASTASTGGVGISYLAAGGTTWTAFATGNIRLHTGDSGKVVLRYGCSWPSATLETGEPIRVDFKAGSTAGTPAEIQQAIRLIVGTWYEQRESVVVGTIASEVPQAARSLLWMWRA